MIITMERISSKPLPALSPSQRDFLRLHTAPVHVHRWHFAGTQLRASGLHGVATIWRDDVEHLVTLGLMVWGVGCADVALTQRGAVVLERMEEAA